MSEATYAGFKECPSTKNTWPPNEEQVKFIAVLALNKSQDKDVKVLVYWDNPTQMIIDPIHFGQTEYIKRNYIHNERQIKVIIGKED